MFLQNARVKKASVAIRVVRGFNLPRRFREWQQQQQQQQEARPGQVLVGGAQLSHSHTAWLYWICCIGSILIRGLENKYSC